jgi:hypothetical protein
VAICELIFLSVPSIEDCRGDTIGMLAGGRKKPGNFLPGFGMEGSETVYFLPKVSASEQVGHFFGLQRLSFSQPHFEQFQTAMIRRLSRREIITKAVPVMDGSSALSSGLRRRLAEGAGGRELFGYSCGIIRSRIDSSFSGAADDP